MDPLYGVSLLCRIGFTMSLFIGALAFRETTQVRLGVIAGSLLLLAGGGLALQIAAAVRGRRFTQVAPA